MFFFGYSFRGIVRSQWSRALGYDFTTVYGITYVMDGHSGFGLSGCFYSFMNVMSIHPDSAEFGQERRVKIYYPVVVGIDKKIWYDEQKSCEHYEVDSEFLHQRHQLGLVVEVFLGHDYCGYSVVLRPYEGICVGLVAQDYRNLDFIRAAEMTDEGFAVRSVAGDENSHINHIYVEFGCTKIMKVSYFSEVCIYLGVFV